MTNKFIEHLLYHCQEGSIFVLLYSQSFLGKFTETWVKGQGLKLKKKKKTKEIVKDWSPVTYVFTFQKDDKTGVMETFQSYRLRVSCLRLLTSVIICLGLRNPMSTFKIT